MDGTTPKVSFIPKGSLVREESFLERPRPRSAIGLLAMLAFVVSVGSYAGLYFYNISLDKDVAAKMNEIEETKKIFSEAPQVGEAQVFLSRTELARELLGGHTAVSPALAFLSRNTLGDIFYGKFSFTRDANGGTLELSGEAPTYAVLAYQGDILRERTEELSSFKISNIALTKFGTVTFTLSLSFAPRYLSYANSLSGAGSAPAQTSSEMMTVPSPGILQGGNATGTVASTAISSSTVAAPLNRGTLTVPAVPTFSGGMPDTMPEQKTLLPAEAAGGSPTALAVPEQSVMSSFWSWFKFW